MVVETQYKIPSMSEIKAVPKNGLKLVSTFSGAGGSCLGFTWAGFSTLYASEFVEEARTTYQDNFPNVPVDPRDIRDVEPKEILDRIQCVPDVLEGSPPCASFSTAGKIDKTWGLKRKYSSKVQRVDDLFFEYARILDGLQPKAFVAENVTGLVRGSSKGYYLEIFKRLEGCGYNVQSRILNGRWLGLPQERQRLIFIGIRNDLKKAPKFPKPQANSFSVLDALEGVHNTPDDLKAADISKYAVMKHWRPLRPGEKSAERFNLIKVNPMMPCPTIVAQGVGSGSVTHWSEPRVFTIPELKRLSGFPDDYALKGLFRKQWERLGRAVPPPMMKAVADSVAEVLLS